MRLSHAQLEKFVQDTLSKREPCPAMVLAWGWMLKQGEGGVFHSDTYKQRYFVLARVPHATVLIYYGEKTMDEENILGFIDLRRVTAVREGNKTVSVDNAKGAASALMSKMKGVFGSGKTGSSRPVVELVMSGRTYVLAPLSIHMPPPMTNSMALTSTSAATSRPLYLFGWPFPVPPFDATDDGVVPKEGEEAVFPQWRDVLATAVASEKATRVFPVVVLVDSTTKLPQRVFLRTTPCELAIVSVDDKDLCFTSVPYNDLVKWEVQVETELHITARTRSTLIARSDRTGFTSQRPTRATCHFVFKSPVAKTIAQVVDNHLRALHLQLTGGVDADGTGAGGTHDDDDDVDTEAFRGPLVGDLDDEDEDEMKDKSAMRKKLAGKAPQPTAEADDDSEDE